MKEVHLKAVKSDESESQRLTRELTQQTERLLEVLSLFKRRSRIPPEKLRAEFRLIEGRNED